jgi:VWFA-related protein
LKSNSQWPTTPAKAGRHRDFYRLSNANSNPVLFETKLSEIEGTIAPILRRLDTELRMPNEVDFESLIVFMALQWIRVPAFRPLQLGLAEKYIRSKISASLSNPEAWTQLLREANLPVGKLCSPQRAMISRIIMGLCIAALFANPRSIGSQSFNLKVAVDEISLTFHATDVNGLPVNDLKLDELKLLDNNRPPRRILVFQSLRDLPIRGGILIDTSQSMEQTRPADQAIAITYAQHILEQKTDQAFVMSFNRRLQMRQAWSNDPAALTTAIHHATASPSTTAIFDTIYAACRYQFGMLPHDGTGNFILLFSDGEDDASYLPLQTTVDMCQQTNTAIYVFRAESGPSFSTGLGTLSQLASLTGGRVFRDSASASEIDEDLRIIQANLRNQYRLVYNPEGLKHDGSFHRIVLLPPTRVAAITVRSGYYAPTH